MNLDREGVVNEIVNCLKFHRAGCIIIGLLMMCMIDGNAQNSFNSLNSVEEELTFYPLDVELGVNTIEQDSLGFIWVGTPGGLSRYDGTQFTSYRASKGVNENQILSDNFILQLCLIEEGKLAITTPEGLNIYDPRTETFKILNKKNGFLSDNISRFVYGDKGEYILGVYDEGVQIIDSVETTALFQNKPGDLNSLSSNEILSMVRQGDSLLWVGTKRNGLNKIDYHNNRVTRVQLKANGGLEGLMIEALKVDSHGNLWVGSNDGLHVITNQRDTLHMNESQMKGKGLSDNNVVCIEEDDLGQIWIGTRNGGLNIIDKQAFLQQTAEFSVKWYLPREDGKSVNNRTVTALKKDWDGNIWIGTSTGLIFVNPDGEPVKLLQKQNSISESVGHDRISALAESHDGKIWIGTDGSGLDLFDPNNSKFKHFKHRTGDQSSLSNDYIISLLEDSNKRLWVGTYLGGINKLNVKTGKFERYLQGSQDNGSDVRVIYEDNENQIWVGTNRGGLYKYVEKIDKFEYVNSLGKLDIRDIKEGDDGNFWMATYGDGILKYNSKTDQSEFFNSSNIDGFYSDVILSIVKIGNGDLIAGTQNEGLIKFNPNTRSVSNFTESDGLSNNSISSIVIQDRENLWLGAYRGISHFNPSTEQIYNLNTYPNIQQGIFRCGLISKSGVIYLGGDRGLNIFNPNNLASKKQVHPIVFKKLEVLDKIVQVSDGNSKDILDSSILYEDHINLNYKQTFLSLDYVALQYPFVKHVIYSYLVEGYNDHWISTNESGKVNLIKIPPGEYVLNVKAQFRSGDEVTKKLIITMNPPWWQTPFAYLCYFLITIAIIYGIIRYYSERVKLLHSLEIEKKERQLEYDFNEERIRFFTSFSHELKTPLTLILAPLEDLIDEIKSIKHKNSLKLVQKSAKQLLQTINKLLEFRKANLGLSKLRIDEINLTEYLEQWVNNYYPLARKRGMALSYDFPDEDLIVWLDLEKMHVIFNNLLSNAFKYTGDNGEIHVSLDYDEESFEIKVRDSGYGIAPNELEHVCDRYFQSNKVKSKEGIGIGLALSKSFAELHLGTIHIKSELNKGSTFSVVIPRDKALFVNAVLDSKKIGVENENEDMDGWVDNSKLMSSEALTSNVNTSENKELILLIDDNPDILNYLDGLLDGKYDLIYANDGEEGKQKALKYVPDLIVSDVMMPKMNGIELCNVLKETVETTHIPIILLTAKSNLESIEEGYKHGADDYIVKPFSSQILQARIRNLLDIRKQLRNYFLNKKQIDPEILSKNPSILEHEKEFLKKLDGIIISHIDDDKFDVWAVSRDIGMSRTSLYRKIKAITGLNINQYIRKVKIDRAAELLKSGTYTIAQASYEVGFSNVKYFRKLFKEQHQQLPSELKKNTRY